MEPSRPQLLLLVRAECGLCEAMQRALAALGRRVPLPPVELRDVDADPVLERRYGLEVPVLLIDGIPASRVELDVEEVLKRLRRRI